MADSLDRPLRPPRVLRPSFTLETVRLDEPNSHLLISRRGPTAQREGVALARLRDQPRHVGRDRLPTNSGGHHTVNCRIVLAEQLPRADDDARVAGRDLLV